MKGNSEGKKKNKKEYEKMQKKETVNKVKGVRNFIPDKMIVRIKTFDLISIVFKKYGADKIYKKF